MGQKDDSHPTTAAVILDPQHWSKMQQVCSRGPSFQTFD